MSEEFEAGGVAMTIRPFAGTDRAALERFGQVVPPHDLLFLDRDLRQPKVIEAWVAAAAAGEIDSLVALADGEIVASTASIRDPLSWSPHVCQIRMLVLPALRGKGLGRVLLQRCVERAMAAGSTKLVARMTPDQVGAITLFEESGFRAEALLAKHVRDELGALHDLVILSLDPQREAARQAAFD